MGVKQDKFEDYGGFVEKFKPKKTTDDCITPQYIYDEVLAWARENIPGVAGSRILRPFWPGADFTMIDYGPDDVVLDNPPFSMLAKIVDWFLARNVRFFLFAPNLTLFSGARPGVTYIVTHGRVRYENRADVATSFVTNMEGKCRVIVAGDLCKRIKAAVRKHTLEETKPVRKLSYPDTVITSAILGKIATAGVCFKIPMEECAFVRRLDCGLNVFGGGFLISERAAAERAAAERIKLSEREQEIIKSLENN